MYKFVFLLTSITIYFVFAKGTLAGTTIYNSAKIHYNNGNNKVSVAVSNSDSFVVDRVVDVKLNSQDVKPVEVSTLEKNRVLTFILTNLGNSDDNITLNLEHNSSSDFRADNIRIFQDSNNNKIFDSEDKEINRVFVKADESSSIFVVGDIPENNSTAPKAKDIEILTATTSFLESKNADIKDSIDTVYRDKSSKDSSSWTIRDYWLASKKSSTILSSDGRLHTGSIIEYKIDTYIDGNNQNQEIKDIVISDTLSDKVEYVANSLKLDNKKLSDKKDSDEGSYNSSNIVVNVGTIMGSAHKILTFRVKVK